MTLIFFSKGIPIITCIYTYAFSCLLDFTINTASVNSAISSKTAWSYGNSHQKL